MGGAREHNANPIFIKAESRQMKVLFIHPVPKLWEGYNGFYQGIGYISSILKRAGHKTALIEPFRYEPAIIDKNLSIFKPDVIAISVTSNQVRLSEKIIEFINSRCNKPIVLGGAHPTVAPEEVIELEGVLGVCIGEGEYPMLELVGALEKGKDYTNIKNFWFKKNGDIIVKNDCRSLIEDLDSLPFPDRELYNYQKMLDTVDLGVEFMGSRGCPMQCAFCINHTLQKLFEDKGRYVRYRGVDNLLEEIEIVRSKYKNANYIGFHDDTFTINKNWLEEFCDKYFKYVKLPFWCNVRADTVDKRIVDMLKKAGCVCVHVGIESGSDYIRNTILKKEITKAQVINCFRLFKEAGIKTSAFNMIGLPYETPKMIEETIELNRIVKPDYVFVSVFYPYYGTELRALCKEKGWISQREVDSYFEASSVLDQPSITGREIEYYYKIFQPLVNYTKFEFLIRILGKLWIWRKITVLDVMRFVKRALRDIRSKSLKGVCFK